MPNLKFRLFVYLSPAIFLVLSHALETNEPTTDRDTRTSSNNHTTTITITLTLAKHVRTLNRPSSQAEEHNTQATVRC